MGTLKLRSIVASALLVLCLHVPNARATIDYTDIWYALNGAESGWGANFAQSGDFIFVTFFIYDTNGAPVWYTAELRRTSGESFSGPVFVWHGTWFGAATFPPLTARDGTQVGDATFTATSSFTGTLRYRVDTVNVTKTVERQTTTGNVVTGLYLGGMARSYSGCSSNATLLNTAQLRITALTGNMLRFDFFNADSTNVSQICAMQGDAVQHGKIVGVPTAPYQCVGGAVVTAQIDSIRRLDDGIEMHWHAALGAGCVEQGRLTGVTQQ